MTEVWTKWEGLVINGVFPLRRLLSASDHSAVFLTEHKAQNLSDAALKLVQAIPVVAQAQLRHWTTTAALSHPHLIRILETGRCELDGLEFLFVVMEYADQSLSQVLPQRALTPDEVREMLIPTLSALAFLHGKNLVQGELRPSNILVVKDQLKLASDTVRPAGESAANIAKPSAYDPPEAKAGRLSASGDIWSLGITMVEALTQHPPLWPDDKSETASFSAALPPVFAEIVRQCLNRNPANRPTAADLQAEIQPAPQLPAVPATEPPITAADPPVSVPQPVASTPQPAQPSGELPMRRFLVPGIAALIIVGVVWAALHMHRSQTSSERPALPAAAPTAAASQNPETPPPSPPQVSAPSPSVLHEEIPDVPRHARDTIRGHIKVAVRVSVDSSGNVVSVTLDNSGSSQYFAHLATEAARKWKFAPASTQDTRKWLLRFEFSRSGATGHAATPSS